MRARARGIAAAEVTIVGAALAFLVTIIVPTMDALNSESANLPQAGKGDDTGQIFKSEPVKSRRQFKQLALAVINYENSVGPVLEDVFTTVADDEVRDPEYLVDLILELGENAELYRQFLVTVRHHLARADSREDIEYLRSVESHAQEMVNHISTLQAFLDVLVLPEEVLREYESEEEIVDSILRKR